MGRLCAAFFVGDFYSAHAVYVSEHVMRRCIGNQLLLLAYALVIPMQELIILGVLDVAKRMFRFIVSHFSMCTFNKLIHFFCSVIMT